MFTSLLASLQSPRLKLTGSLSHLWRSVELARKVFLTLLLLVFLVGTLTALACNSQPNPVAPNKCFSLSSTDHFTFTHAGTYHLTLTTACNQGGPTWQVFAYTNGQEPDGTATGSQIPWLSIDPTRGHFAQKDQTQDLTVTLGSTSYPLPQTKGNYLLTIMLYQEPAQLLDATYGATVIIN